MIQLDEVKRLAKAEGFVACGVAEARPVSREAAASYRGWIARGRHATMHYLENHLEKRLDPTLLLPGARSIIVVALNYAPARRPDGDTFQLAAYAYGQDYHDVVRRRLIHLAETLCLGEGDYKIASDTVPLLERYWAEQAGVGFTGRHHQLIVPGYGSMVFLGEIVTTMAADRYDQPCTLYCGSCHRCIDACPTRALPSPEHQDETGESTPHDFVAERCLSYQTIENRGDLSEMAKASMGHGIYGCDRCQEVCPWNARAVPTDIPELQPSEALLAMSRDDWHRLSREDYQRLFKGSAVKRAKYEGLMRNIRAVEEQDNNCANS